MAYGPYPDIVAALRVQAGAEDHRGAGGLCRDAAKEIERLREALKEIADDGKNCEGYCRRQAARALNKRS